MANSWSRHTSGSARFELDEILVPPIEWPMPQKSSSGKAIGNQSSINRVSVIVRIRTFVLKLDQAPDDPRAQAPAGTSTPSPGVPKTQRRHGSGSRHTSHVSFVGRDEDAAAGKRHGMVRGIVERDLVPHGESHGLRSPP